MTSPDPCANHPYIVRPHSHRPNGSPTPAKVVSEVVCPTCRAQIALLVEPMGDDYTPPMALHCGLLLVETERGFLAAFTMPRKEA